MESAIREYDAKLDSKKRLTLREAGYEYYHVSVLPDQRIVLEPRVLTTPFEVSANTLKMMDSSVDNMKKGKVSPAIACKVTESQRIVKDGSGPLSVKLDME